MKKSIFLLLLGVLLGTVLPAGAQIAQDTCGTCAWTVSTDGTLTITPGTLDAWETQAPWADYAAQVRAVSIPASTGTVVPTTLHAMFQGMSEATTFDLSGLRMDFAGDRSASQDLFRGCTALRMLTLPAQTDIVWQSTALTLAGGCRLQAVGSGTALALPAAVGVSLAPVAVEQEGNWLAGCYTAFSIAGDRDYVMQNKASHGVAFYPVNPDKPVKAKAFRSFLRLPADAPEVAALALQLPADPTAIAPVAPPQAAVREGVYTLSGQPVEHMRPGQVYIINGRKVVVR